MNILCIVCTMEINLRKYEASSGRMVDTLKGLGCFCKIRVVIVKVDPVNDVIADETSMILSGSHDTLVDLSEVLGSKQVEC